MKREHKSFDVEFKATEQGIIEGYAAYFNNVDSYGDIILKGAFADTIAGAKANNYKDIKIFWNHDWSGVPIGKPIEMYEDDKGLYIKGQLNETTTAQDVKLALKDGSVSKMSIGFLTEIDEMKKVEGIMRRLLKKLKLFEFSPVNFPANEMADILGYKKEGAELDIKKELEEIKTQIAGMKQVDIKAIDRTMTISHMLKEKIKEVNPNMIGYLEVNAVMLDECVYNNWLWTENGVGEFDIYYRQSYERVGDGISLVGVPTEVQPTRSFVDKKGEKLQQTEKKDILNAINSVIGG